MKRKEYEEKLRAWEAEGYDVSELREKWFPLKGRKSRIGIWLSLVVVIFIAVAGVVVWQAMQPAPPSVPAVRIPSPAPTTSPTPAPTPIPAPVAVARYTLATSASPAGAGSVSPGSGTYDTGASVSAVASPAPGYIFDHWSGDFSGTSPTMVLTMDSNKNVVANFVPVYSLSKSINPPEGGSITVSPPSAPYGAGATVTLEAAAAPGYRFSHWSGDAFGTNSITTITMDSNKTVIANFVVIRVSLITSVSPLGAGTVNPSSGTYDMGSKVTLTASPASGYRFALWSGDATGTSSAISITMDSDKNIIANFVSEQLKVSFGGWYVGGIKVDTATKGNNVVVKMTISGGTPGQYKILVRRDIVWAEDQTVSELTFNHEGALSTKDLAFVAAYATGEASTDGYHVDVVKDGYGIWSMTNAYPPRLRVNR